MYRIHGMLALVLALTALPDAANAGGCRMLSTAGSKCIQAPNAGSYILEPGAELPEDARLVFNPRYYGLPPVDGSWRYYIVGREIYRVDSASLLVIERARGGNRSLW